MSGSRVGGSGQGPSWEQGPGSEGRTIDGFILELVLDELGAVAAAATLFGSGVGISGTSEAPR